MLAIFTQECNIIPLSKYTTDWKLIADRSVVCMIDKLMADSKQTCYYENVNIYHTRMQHLMLKT